MGSPPPMRGKAWVLLCGFIASRITPAYAGKSLGLISIRSHIQDHPRLCGEKFSARIFKYLSMGSPPPMRGKAEAWKIGGYRSKDHPRLCGEKQSRHQSHFPPEGSPPPMRGKDFEDENFDPEDRITPAYAGKSGRL